MAMLVLLAVVGLTVMIMLLFAICVVDSHAEQQGKRFRDLMRSSCSSQCSNFRHRDGTRDGPKIASDREMHSHYCRNCGSSRTAWQHGFDVLSQAKVASWRAPWKHVAAVREKIATSTKNAFGCVTNFQDTSSHYSMDFTRHIVRLGSVLRKRGSRQGIGRSCAEPSEFIRNHCGESTLGNSVVSWSSKTKGETWSNASSAVAPTSIPVTSTSALCTGIPFNMPALSSRLDGSTGNGMEAKSIPYRRLVLEILIPPSAGGDGQAESSDSSCTSGVRLKLETSGSLEHLINSTSPPDFTFDIGDLCDSDQQSRDAAAVKVLSISSEATPIARQKNTVSYLGCKQEPQILMENVNQGGCLRESSSSSTGRSLSDIGIRSFEMPCIEARPAASVGANDARSEELMRLKTKEDLVMSLKGTGSRSLEQKNSAVQTIPLSINGLPNAFVQLKITTSSCGTGAMKPVSVFGLDDSLERQQQSLVPEECSDPAPFVSLNGLGSLQIRILKGGSDVMLSEECIKDVSFQAVSALATLNIGSVHTKEETGVGTGIDVKGDGLKNYSVLERDCPNVTTYESYGPGVELDGIVIENKHAVLPASTNDGCEDGGVDVKKKEKKKKNRGRRQKGKGIASSAVADRECEMGKSVLDAAKHVSLTFEREYGCVCGTPKGGSHSRSCPFPFTSSGSMLQNKIKEQYDEIVQSNASKSLTLAQVGRFTTCLVEAKATLQRKSEMIQRRFTIVKSLLTKADKSSFDRLCGQIYGLEIEQKRLEEDTVVYNRLQEQLKLSPAYQKMLEYGRTHFELQPRTGQMIEKVDAEDMEMTFEELLAQEKKDAFWKKRGLARSSVQVG
eukprot:c28794_g1_i2 orf=582-3110(-)